MVTMIRSCDREHDNSGDKMMIFNDDDNDKMYNDNNYDDDFTDDDND